MIYRIVSRKLGKKEDFIYFAVNYIAPSMIKVSSNTKLCFNSKIYVDDDIAYYNKKYLGKIIDYKSSSDIIVSTDYSIKYTGGYSLDGKKIFLDKNFPKSITVKGKAVNTVDSIARHHELVEKWMIDLGYKYAYSHRIATSVEREFISMLGINWNDYDKYLGRHLHENYRRKLENSPLDLDLIPYVESKDTLALKEIKESINTMIIDIAQ
jgi:hypothetical protein